MTTNYNPALEAELAYRRERLVRALGAGGGRSRRLPRRHGATAPVEAAPRE